MPEQSSPADRSRRQLRFLALGDSYTIGESVIAADRWPVQLVRMLRDDGVKIGEPTIIATTGWTTAELLAGIDRARSMGPFDLVSLLIGVNNQFRGRSEREYRQEFAVLLGRAIELARGDASRAIVLSVPDWGMTPFARGRDRARIAVAINRFNAINRAESARVGARYVDVTPASRDAAKDPRLVAADGLHPSGKMYRVWAGLVISAARAALAVRE